MIVERVNYGTEKYKKTVSLRNEELRLPWGRTMNEDDLSTEEDKDIVLAIFDKEDIIGVGVLTPVDMAVIKIRYLCVDSSKQNGGVGKAIVKEMENVARKSGYEKIILESRESSRLFYEKLGYVTIGDTFTPAFAPVEHIDMKKIIVAN